MACKAKLIPQQVEMAPAGQEGCPAADAQAHHAPWPSRGLQPPLPQAAADYTPIWCPVPPGRSRGPRDWAFLGQGPLAWPGPPGSLVEWEAGRQAARWVLGVTAP